VFRQWWSAILASSRSYLVIFKPLPIPSINCSPTRTHTKMPCHYLEIQSHPLSNILTFVLFVLFLQRNSLVRKETSPSSSSHYTLQRQKRTLPFPNLWCHHLKVHCQGLSSTLDKTLGEAKTWISQLLFNLHVAVVNLVVLCLLQKISEFIGFQILQI